MPTHVNLRWTEMEAAMAGARKLQALASQYGITDIFSDNGGKVAQIAVAVGLDIVSGRTGADATDRLGNEYELKTVDIDKKARGFSTSHHLNENTIAKYRRRRFVFGIYEGIVLKEVYLVEAGSMDPIFQAWESRLRSGKTHLNNPKIPLDFIREIGITMYLKDVAPSWASGKEKAAA